LGASVLVLGAPTENSEALGSSSTEAL
jgi:hypothetical protein